MDINNVVIAGNITKDIEVRYVTGGEAVVNFCVAVNSTYIHNKTKKKATEFIDCVAWGKQAEACGKYLAKGAGVAVLGKLKTTMVDYKNVRYKKVELVASKVIFGDRSDKDAAEADDGNAEG